MNRNAKIWIKQANKDFENAIKNYNLKEYYLSAFLIQQSLEKYLKGLYILDKNDFANKTDSLIFLGKQLNLPPKLLTKLKKINPDFIMTRYPDFEGVPPYESYDKEILDEKISDAKIIIKWIKEKIK